jgi:Ca-activated chloride channel family protein
LKVKSLRLRIILFKYLLFLSFIFFNIGWTFGDSLAAKNKEAVRLYKEGKTGEALSKWRDAQIENPDNVKLYYNIGNGLHEQKKYEEAFKEYEKSLGSKDSEVQQKAYYNMGNTHYRMGKLLEAIEDYKKCLEISPDDEDAKYNIEFIKKKLEEQKKQKPEKDKDQEQKEAQRPEGQEENKQGQEREKEGEAQKEQQGRQREGREAGAEEEIKGPEKEKAEEVISKDEDKDGMSKQDAMRLLDAIKDDEKDLQKELRNQPIEGEHRVDKDW